nr:hypothetical protein [Tanacetum cinerariifolium]
MPTCSTNANCYTTATTTVATAAAFPAAAAAMAGCGRPGCPPPNHHRGGGQTTVQPPQPHLVVSGLWWYMLARLDGTERGYRRTWTRLGLYQAVELEEEGFNVYFEGSLRSEEHFNAQDYWMGRIDIRQEAIKWMEYRQSYHWDRNMNTTQAQEKALDDALDAPADRLEFKKCNMRLKINNKPKEAIFQVVLDVLALIPFYQAFMITAKVPYIYMQEFWATIFAHKDLGHTGDITYLADVNVDYLHQPCRVFATVINKCLSGKETRMDKIRLSRDGVDTQSKVLDEQQQKVSGINKGAGITPEVPDVPKYNSESEEESWTFSQDDKDAEEESNKDDDSEGTKSDNDEDDLTYPNLVSALESEMSEFRQTSQFSKVVSSISGIVDMYLASKMKEAVDAIIKEHVQAQVSKIMPKIEKYVTKSLGAKVLTDQTLRRIFTMYWSNHTTLTKTSLPHMGDVVTLKRGRDDQDKDEHPSVGSN